MLIGPAEGLIKEIDGLSLTKYLEEIVAAVVEGACKGRGDPEVAVEVSDKLAVLCDTDFDIQSGDCAPTYSPNA